MAILIYACALFWKDSKKNPDTHHCSNALWMVTVLLIDRKMDARRSASCCNSKVSSWFSSTNSCF